MGKKSHFQSGYKKTARETWAKLKPYFSMDLGKSRRHKKCLKSVILERIEFFQDEQSASISSISWGSWSTDGGTGRHR